MQISVTGLGRDRPRHCQRKSLAWQTLESPTSPTWSASQSGLNRSRKHSAAVRLLAVAPEAEQLASPMCGTQKRPSLTARHLRETSRFSPRHSSGSPTTTQAYWPGTWENLHTSSASTWSWVGQLWTGCSARVCVRHATRRWAHQREVHEASWASDQRAGTRWTGCHDPTIKSA